MEKLAIAGFLLVYLLFCPISYCFELPIEAESFKLIKGWKITDDGYFPSLPNFFSRQKIEADSSDNFAQASFSFDVPETKTYKLWVRYESCYGFGSVFNVKIVQKNAVKAQSDFGRKEDKKFFPFGRGETVQGPWDWHNTDYVYQGMEAKLEKGPATIILTKSKNQKPAARRIIDLFYLTDDLTIVPGNDWIWSRGNRPPILSRFTEPVYVRASVESGSGLLKLITGFAILGAHPYAPREIYFISKSGIRDKQPDKKEYLDTGSSTDWYKVNVYTVAVPEIVVSQIGDAIMNVDIALGKPSNIVKTIKVGPGKEEKTVFVAVGLKKYEKGLLGNHKALTFDEMIKKQIGILEKYNPPGKSAKKILLTGVIRDIFPELQFQLAVASGLNGQAYSTHPLIYGTDSKLKGFNTDTGFYSLQNAHLTKDCYEGDFSKLETRYRQIADDLFKKLGRTLPLHIKLLEETGPPNFETLMSWPKCKEMFDLYLKQNGLSYEQVSNDSDLFHYHSIRFRTKLFAKVNAEATRLIEKIFPAGTVVNSGSVFPTIGGFPSIARGDDIFLLFRERGVTEYSSEISWGLCGSPDYIGPQTQSYEAALARALSKYYNCPFGSYLIAAGTYGYSPEFVELASYLMYGSGFKWLHYYVFGFPDGCTYMGHPEIMKATKNVNKKIGVVEDYLFDAKVVPGKIAIGWSSTTDIWDLARKPSYPHSPGNCVYPQERHLLYLLLRHLQYPVEILSEEDLIEGYLKDFDVYFLIGDHLKPEAANAIKDWVKNGGILISVAGGGLFDHYNKPLDTLKDVFGISQAKLEKTVDAIRPKLELLHLQPLDVITFNSGKKMKVFGYKQTFVVGDGKVIGVYQNGEPAAVEKIYGKGRAIIIGALPGPAYVKDAIPVAPYGRGGYKDELSLFFPTQYNKEVRSIIKDLLGDVKSNLVCSHPLVEGVLLERKDGYVITLTNFSMKKQKNITVEFFPPQGYCVKKIFSPYGKIGIDRSGEKFIIKIPEIDKFHCIVFEQF
ncbi:MAG: beta-galactosidase trimerization domain-containing protein [Candidatus Omnitrophica bacterium]|nr:beta-galactosidase trimerization domain-containing protein [Candidatus Omnitrophota bacterium]